MEWKEWKMEKIIMKIVATNVVASRPTATPTARANISATPFIVTSSSEPFGYWDIYHMAIVTWPSFAHFK